MTGILGANPNDQVDSGDRTHGQSPHHHRGSRGIGAETALLAARQGYRICLNYQSDEAAAQRMLDQVRALGAQAIAVRADVSIEDEVIALFSRVDAELGRVTALVNNAGTVGHKSRVDEMSEFRILKTIKTNVLGPILCAKHAVLRMSPKHGGRAAVSSMCRRRRHAWVRRVNMSTMPPPKVPWTVSPLACPKRWRVRGFVSTRCALAISLPTFTP